MVSQLGMGLVLQMAKLFPYVNNRQKPAQKDPFDPGRNSLSRSTVNMQR